VGWEAKPDEGEWSMIDYEAALRMAESVRDCEDTKHLSATLPHAVQLIVEAALGDGPLYRFVGPNWAYTELIRSGCLWQVWPEREDDEDVR